MNSNQDKVFKGISSQTLIVVIKGILEIIYFSIMSRLLTQSDFGYFAIITAVVIVLNGFSEAGLGSAIIQSSRVNEKYINTAFSLSVLLGLTFSIVLYLLSSFLSNIMTDTDILSIPFKLMSIVVLLNSLNGIARAVLMKNLNFLRYGIFEIISYLLSSLVGVILALKGCGFYAIVFSTIMNLFFMFLILYVLNRFFPRLKLDLVYVREIVSYGGWLTGSVIIRTITEQLDKLVVSKFMPISLIGAYNRPSGFVTQITSQVNGIFDTILFPILSNVKENTQQVASSYCKAVVLVQFCSFILMSIFILGADLIIKIFFGTEWLYLVPVFQIISCSICFLAYSRIADCYFRSLGILKKYCLVRAIMCLVTIICVIVGCQFGITGLAVFVLISRVIETVIKEIFLRKIVCCSYFKIVNEIIQSIKVPLLFLSIGVLIKVYLNSSAFSVIFFILMLGLLLVFYPSIFGQIYKENIYNKYIKRFI